VAKQEKIAAQEWIREQKTNSSKPIESMNIIEFRAYLSNILLANSYVYQFIQCKNNYPEQRADIIAKRKDHSEAFYETFYIITDSLDYEAIKNDLSANNIAPIILKRASIFEEKEIEAIWNIIFDYKLNVSNIQFWNNQNIFGLIENANAYQAAILEKIGKIEKANFN